MLKRNPDALLQLPPASPQHCAKLSDRITTPLLVYVMKNRFALADLSLEGLRWCFTTYLTLECLRQSVNTSSFAMLPSLMMHAVLMFIISFPLIEQLSVQSSDRNRRGNKRYKLNIIFYICLSSFTLLYTILLYHLAVPKIVEASGPVSYRMSRLLKLDAALTFIQMAILFLGNNLENYGIVSGFTHTFKKRKSSISHSKTTASLEPRIAMLDAEQPSLPTRFASPSKQFTQYQSSQRRFTKYLLSYNQ